jgi:hypothetical protein
MVIRIIIMIVTLCNIALAAYIGFKNPIPSARTRTIAIIWFVGWFLICWGLFFVDVYQKK